MAMKKTATKRKTTKRKTTKRTPAPKQAASPKEIEIKGELRYKLEAMQLKIDNRREAISAPLLVEQQQKFNDSLARTLRNDTQFTKLSDEWKAMLDVVDAKYTPGEGYTLRALNPETGVLTFVPAAE